MKNENMDKFNRRSGATKESYRTRKYFSKILSRMQYRNKETKNIKDI